MFTKLFRSHGTKCVHAKKGIAKLLLAFIVAFLISGGIISTTYGSKTTYTVSLIRPAIAEQSGPSWEEKIREQQHKVIDDLGTKCESATWKEKGFDSPDALVIFDPDKTGKAVNVPSYGWLQFKVKTVQGYYKQLHQKQLTQLEAQALAHNHEQARDLARYVIFDLNEGPANWTNCFRSGGLQARVELINDFAK